ncbi:hypothetical protein BJP34_35115 [Moorena producens PAL-8-15-08-1]|uniref:Uncharacterized protein n=2 Tax=Moorena TaxID=1155738 RepID=A0A1D8U2M9_9CYAN|nr:hypothetical protein [Moorena producens]AOX03966.1 hypothetical protein BJP34_35115 [Moorena producens PAL-8-15-08-1]
MAAGKGFLPPRTRGKCNRGNKFFSLISQRNQFTGDLPTMITISDLKVSRENCLTELKDAEMMGHIIGGFTLRVRGIGFGLGNQLGFDLDDDGTIVATEIFTPLSGTFGFDIDFSKLKKSQPTHTDDCPEGM